MNKNYKDLPTIQLESPTCGDYDNFFTKNINHQIYVIIIDNMEVRDKLDFYCDDSKKEIYFELSTRGFKRISNHKLFKNRINQIHKNYYQISAQQPSTTTKTNISTIDKLKVELERIQPDLLSQIRVKENKPQYKNITFKLYDLDIWSPIELKNSVEELLKSFQSNNQEQSTIIQANNNIEDNKPELPKVETIATYPIFQKNYTNLDKDRIKEVLKKIPIEKLTGLELRELKLNTKDGFDKLIKTNFKIVRKKPILFYQEADLSIINQFLRKSKQDGYKVKYCREDRKKIVYNGIKINLSNDHNHKIIQNNIEYYINFDGKIYYYLVLIDNNNPKNNKRLVINYNNDLSKIQKEKIQQTYQKLENENIENKFNKMYDLLTKFINFI
jgi:hypothetical protein